MRVKNTATGRILVIDVDELGALGFVQAKRHMPRLRVEARTEDKKRLFLVALADLEPANYTTSDLGGLAARSVS